MRTVFVLLVLGLAAATAQAAVLPAFLPESWRPDACLLVALVCFPFLPRTTALYFVFALGLAADVLCGPRLGALTCCYLLAGGALLGFERELVRAGPWGGWLAAIAGTGVAYLAYGLAGLVLGLFPDMGAACGMALSKTLAATVFGLPTAFVLARTLAGLGMLAPEAEKRSRARRKLGMAWTR